MTRAMPPHNPLFGRYEIVRELALGGTTKVYEARDTATRMDGRLVTLKLVKETRHVAYFMEAARFNAALVHAHIPQVHEVGELEGQIFAVRAFVAGHDLQKGIGASKQSVPRLTAIITDVAAALDYGRLQGIVHGSVHPRHILLAKDGTAWLIGFGEYPPPEDVPFLAIRSTWRPNNCTAMAWQRRPATSTRSPKQRSGYCPGNIRSQGSRSMT